MSWYLKSIRRKRGGKHIIILLFVITFTLPLMVLFVTLYRFELLSGITSFQPGELSLIFLFLFFFFWGKKIFVNLRVEFSFVFSVLFRFNWHIALYNFGLPRWLSGKKSSCSAGDVSSVPGLGRSPGGGNGKSEVA